MLSVGGILKKEREKQGLSLKEIEKTIKVREKFLLAVESDDWREFSSKIYITGIIKNYSRVLGLDPKRTLAFFRRDYEKKEEVGFKQKVASHYLTPETKKIAKYFLIAVFVLFAAYFIYQLKIFLSPPEVAIISPKVYTVKKENKIRIVGKSEKDTAITIFGERVYQKRDGVFEYDFPLKVGNNELIIEAVGANGKKTVLKQNFIMTQ